ncbi:MAG: sigma-70 family RNA polymerase sigma factor [Actinobacteria bacterium]|nr:sigma-70 family RNA polymerase sigma factor [Actinomycetota bacterium]
MAQLIAALPEEERIILTLFYLKSESADSIAKRLGVPERAVESVLISGRSRLLASLGLDTSKTADKTSDKKAEDHAQEGKQE